MAAHFQHEGWQRQHKADPEPPRHVGELGVGRRVQARDLRLQRHAADRAAAGTDLADLRMHRAGIDGAFRRLGFWLALVEILLGRSGEFGPAAGRAEMMGFAAVVEAVPACHGIDRHAANGIDHLRRTCGRAVTGVMMVMAVVLGMAAAAGGFCRRGLRLACGTAALGRLGLAGSVCIFAHRHLLSLGTHTV